MLSRRFLSLSLAVGLVVGASSAVFADNEGLGGTDLEPCASCSVAPVDPCVKELAQALVIQGYRLMLADALQQCALQLQGFVAFGIVKYCATLKYEQNLERITQDFQRLYTSDLDFRRAVDAAWIGNGSSNDSCHASVSSSVRRHTGFYWKGEPKTKRHTGFYWKGEPKTKRHTGFYWEGEPKAKRHTGFYW